MNKDLKKVLIEFGAKELPSGTLYHEKSAWPILENLAKEILILRKSRVPTFEDFIQMGYEAFKKAKK